MLCIPVIQCYRNHLRLLMSKKLKETKMLVICYIGDYAFVGEFLPHI